MKQFVLILMVAFPGMMFAQLSESQLWENAKYQVKVEGADLFYTDVNSTVSVGFSEQALDRIRTSMFTKEGIVKVEFLHFNQTIRVYHFDYIDLETIKNFVLSDDRQDIEVMNRFEYNF